MPADCPPLVPLMTNSQLPLVSVLFLTYKRFELLERSVRTFRQNTDYPNLQLVISDDGSSSEIQTRIRRLPADVFALMPKNRGLGANNNNGLRHCTGKYILMIQDDCMCSGPPDYLRNTIQIMEANPDVGLVNYYGAPHPLDESRALAGSSEPSFIATAVDFLYADQPHVMSRAAFDLIGYYIEPRGIGNCEDDYRRRWQAQDRFATAIFPAYYNKLFVHEGEAHSFRANLFSNRVDAFLMPFAIFLRQRCRPLFTIGKALVRTSVATMEKLRIVR
jgi:glycosyltransferase involved in cell wall biosynthesis